MAFEAVKQKSSSHRIFTLGPLIHNSSVTERLLAMGAEEISSLSQANSGDTVIVRSHGEPISFYEEAKSRAINIVDTTCVFVDKIHKLVNKAYHDGRDILIVGNKNHPEVIATNGWCSDKAIILSDSTDAKSMLSNNDLHLNNPLLVCQTTYNADKFNEIIQILNDADFEYELNNTICNATRERQASCEELSKQVDLMIVVGDKTSSNCRELYQIAKSNCEQVKFIQNYKDLVLQDIEIYNNIGVIAGASTPEWIVKEVLNIMSSKIAKQDASNPMFQYMEEIEKSLRMPKVSELIDGVVDQVFDDYVVVNLGCKKDGILTKDEVALENGQSLNDLFHPGDEIKAKVLKSEDNEGGIMLSVKRLVAAKNFLELEEIMNNKETIEVKIIKAVNGGVVAGFKEVSGFIPVSQLSDRYLENYDDMIGQTVQVQVLRVDTKRNRAVFSRKAVLLEAKHAAAKEVWDNLNEGDIVEGKVMRFTDYGAFVDIGGVDGLLHISEMSWGNIRRPEDILELGQIVNVVILSRNEEKGKISLSLKRTTPEPWESVPQKYTVGQDITGKVIRIMDYGAFVEIETGLDGLIHISEISHKKIDKVSSELSIGQEVTARIIEIDTERKRIALSMKALIDPPETNEEAAETTQAVETDTSNEADTTVESEATIESQDTVETTNEE